MKPTYNLTWEQLFSICSEFYEKGTEDGKQDCIEMNGLNGSIGLFTPMDFKEQTQILKTLLEETKDIENTERL